MSVDDSVTSEIRLLRQEIAELRRDLSAILVPAGLSVSQKAKIIREAHASGDRARIRQVSKLINTGA